MGRRGLSVRSLFTSDARNRRYRLLVEHMGLLVEQFTIVWKRYASVTCQGGRISPVVGGLSGSETG